MSYIADAIKKVATGPHLSKDLTQQESYQTLLEILDGQADPVQAAIFFIAMRMKRETNEENLGILQALQAYTEQQRADVDELVIMADPYNGFLRHSPLMAFLPAVLAAAGMPAITQGVHEMGPKFGVTHAQVLAAAGVNTQLNIAEATDRINDKNIGWAYLDQAQASPAVYALQDLRTRMIKRPSLATLEKMIMPIKARQNTHLLIGFVHKAYPPVLSWLAHAAGYHSALIIRGIEGGVLPTLRATSNNFRMLNGDMLSCELNPADFGLDQDTRGQQPEDEDQVTAEETVQQGLAALDGQLGVAYDSLVYGAAITLWHLGRYSTPAEASAAVRELLQNGAAKAQFQQGSN